MRISDWSSDVCSSDLTRSAPAVAWLCSALCRSLWAGGANSRANPCDADDVSRERPRLYSFADQIMSSDLRDEERCIQSSTDRKSVVLGKECFSTFRSRWSPDHEKKKI